MIPAQRGDVLGCYRIAANSSGLLIISSDLSQETLEILVNRAEMIARYMNPRARCQDCSGDRRLNSFANV